MQIKNFFINTLLILIFSTQIYANNNCPKWFPMPSSDGLVVVLPIYDESITQPDLDCDGVIDTLDSDIDGDGVANASDAFPLNSSESVDTDGDGIGNNADTDDDNDGYSDVEEIAADSDPLDANDIPINMPNKRIFILGSSTVHAEWYRSESFNDPYGDNRVLEGWGEQINTYTKDPSKIYNRARSGADSISYKTPDDSRPGRTDRHWDNTEALIQSINDDNGGFLLIQFGANDQFHNTVNEFETELRAYVNKAKILNLTPVLISPPARRSGVFDNRDYAVYIEPVAKELEVNVLFLDLFEKSKEAFNGYINSGMTISDIDEIFSYREHDHGINVAHFGRNGAKIVAGWVRELACDPTQHNDRPQSVQDVAVELCSQFVQGELEHPVTMREDAEDGDEEGWTKYGIEGDIENLYDTNKRSFVIELQGDNGLDNGFRLDGDNLWDESEELVVSWDMNYADDFTFFVSVDTEDGYKTFEYKPTDSAGAIVSGRYRFGLGADANDGTWRTFTRDIQADLKSLDPTKNILKIHRIAVRGSGRIDNIRTMESLDSVSRDIAPIVAIKGLMNIELNQGSVYTDAGFTAVDDNDAEIETQVETIGSVDTNTIGTYTIDYKVHDSVGNGGHARRIVNVVEVVDPNADVVTVHEDAEDGDTAGWWGTGAISNEADHGGHVIHFGGDNGSDDAYAMNVNGVTSGFVTSWAIKSTEEFKFIVRVTTQNNGDVYITYTPESIDRGYIVEDGKNYAYFALGDNANDGTWRTFTRDIVADLHKLKEDYVITSITRFYVRGNGSIDDISTSTRANRAAFSYKGHNYEIVKSTLSWQAASDDAVAKGGYLAHISSKEENEEIYSRLFRHISDAELLNTRAGDGGNASYVWIGGSDHTTEGTWRWSDDNVQFTQGDTPAAGIFTNWGQAWDGGHREPDDWTHATSAPQGQDFAAIAVNNPIKPDSDMGNGRDWPWGFSGQWNDVAIGNDLYYIIEYGDEPAVKKIFLIGDSTIQNNRNTIWGIGDKLDTYMRTPSNKFNHARPGSSTKSYRPDSAGTDNDWPGMLTRVNETDITNGAYMFIHFGHNDANLNENLYAAPGRNNAFYNNLKEYVDEIRDLGIIPVLVTPISYMYRNHHHHGDYPQTTIDLASDENVLLLDLTEKSFNEFSIYTSDALLLSAFSRGETDSGAQDRTHFSEQGALEIAGWLKELICESPDQVLCNQFNQ